MTCEDTSDPRACGGVACDFYAGYEAVARSSCASILLSDPTAQSGVYTIEDPDTGGDLNVFCDMDSDDGGWTLVYKIADDSTMRGTGVINAAGLSGVDGQLNSTGSGKLSDVAIRSLC